MLREVTLEDLLGKIFDDLRDGMREEVTRDEYERLKRDFIFHMTDWRDDLVRFAELVSRPDDISQESATKFVVGFLYHVAPHLNVAHRLLLDDAPANLESSQSPDA